MRPEVALPDHASGLAGAIDRAMPALRAIPEPVASRHPKPGKWSPKEIIGHLIDSASNNHQRFVRAQWQEDLVFPGYSQDRWVASQRYQDAPWEELLDLFESFNRQLVRVMAAIPADVRERPRTRHNFHRIAFRTLPETEPATLNYLMQDYVAHLEHHLRQIPV